VGSAKMPISRVAMEAITVPASDSTIRPSARTIARLPD
jgi:hypothetical protein